MSTVNILANSSSTNQSNCDKFDSMKFYCMGMQSVYGLSYHQRAGVSLDGLLYVKRSFTPKNVTEVGMENAKRSAFR